MLPVESVVPELLNTIKQQDVILIAPPGAGKSTCLPLHLLNSEQFAEKQIVMLQPRRVAVRAIAQHLAEQLNEPVGKTVGYRVRGESKACAETRLLIVTEGLLTRMIQSDPALENIGLIIFDEFHERSSHADFSCALAQEVKEGLRDDLALMLMSATLDADSLKKALPAAKLIECEGRSFPIEVHYLSQPPRQELSKAVSNTIVDVLSKHQGSVLAFLPGSREIRDTESLLCSRLASDTEVFALYGELTKAQQMAAISPPEPGKRKVVLATNIAETSLTIEGISVVVDSGLEKVAQFHLGKGIQQLQTQMLSQSSATQRAGRAGRLGPGTCYRLWSQQQHERLASQRTPQLLQVDVSGYVLEALVWGSKLQHLPLIDKPSSAQTEQAESLLLALEAINLQGQLTDTGKAMAKFGCHPRLAKILVYTSQQTKQMQQLACFVVAALEDGRYAYGSDLHGFLLSVIDNKHHRVWQLARQWARRMNVDLTAKELVSDNDWITSLLLQGFPDRLARLRSKGRYLMASGGGVNLVSDSPMHGQQWLIVCDLMLTHGADANVSLACVPSPEILSQHIQLHAESRQSCQWQEQHSRLASVEQTCLGNIVLSSQATDAISQTAIDEFWLSFLADKGYSVLNWSSKVSNFIFKLNLAESLFGQPWFRVDGDNWLSSPEQWLLPYLQGVTTLNGLRNLNWLDMLRSRLEWNDQNRLESLFPQKIEVPTGNKHALTYNPDGSVLLSVRMQEMYGLKQSPVIADGKIIVQVELLSPAGRPIQKTSDLAGFWQGSYKEVQKEMKGRYPKHFWPDNPADAIATTRTKKHM